jgi:hypothetical protein
MKLRHATLALALLGWYLMVPPQTRTWWVGPQRYDDVAPLSSWTIEGSFDNAQLCQATRQQAGDATMGHGTCVATDDPRLKP